MMYERLLVARDLLQDDGVIFVVLMIMRLLILEAYWMNFWRGKFRCISMEKGKELIIVSVFLLTMSILFPIQNRISLFKGVQMSI